jgi:hypothetical protein
MNIRQIDNAVREAERFIQKAEQAKARLIKECAEINVRLSLNFKPVNHTITSKETASCRRASLDLSRSLSELRK